MRAPPVVDTGLDDRFAQFRRDHRSWYDGWVHRDRLELLDLAPQSPGALKVVRDLDAFGRLTGLHHQLARALVARLDASGSADRPAHIIDLCAGYGGFCRYLAAWAARAAMTVEITGVDHSATIVAAAAAQASAAGITWRCADATRLDDADQTFDLAINIQSLHHFDPNTAVALLREMARVARHAFLFDLRRTAYGFLALHLVRPFYSREFVHDGQISHRRAYSVPEAEFLIAEAGIRARARRFLPVGLLIETIDG